MTATKRLLRILFFLVLALPVFSQSADSDGGATLIEVVGDGAGGYDSDDGVGVADASGLDDFDALFSDAEDTDDAVMTDDVRAGTNYNVQLGSLKFPIEFSGRMDAEVGAALIRTNNDTDASFYFDFKNYLYFTIRPDTYLSLRGVLKSSLPSDSGDSESNQLLYLYELYFDYLMLKHVYITAGKKKTVWGNVRLFSNVDDYSGDTDALYTNVLYDSREYISGIVRVPFGNNTVTVVAMYNPSTAGTSPKSKDMSFAVSLEFLLFSTSINFFGRRFPLAEGTDFKNSQKAILGMELKRTILGFDVYGQGMARIARYEELLDVVASKGDDLSAIQKFITTVGTYRLWSDNTPNVGFNFEFQNIYRPNFDDSMDKFTNRFSFDFGFSKLGPNRDIRVGLQWRHDLTNEKGLIKTGVEFSHIMPHCNWRTGIEYEYGDFDSLNDYKLTFGTYFKINLDY